MVELLQQFLKKQLLLNWPTLAFFHRYLEYFNNWSNFACLDSFRINGGQAFKELAIVDGCTVLTIMMTTGIVIGLLVWLLVASAKNASEASRQDPPSHHHSHSTRDRPRLSWLMWRKSWTEWQQQSLQSLSNLPAKSSSVSSLHSTVQESMKWWDDLAPPFRVPLLTTDDFADYDGMLTRKEDSNNDSLHDDDDDEPHLQSRSFSSTSLPEEMPSGVTEEGLAVVMGQSAYDVVHFCFLVHGIRGRSRDLSYLQTVMQHVALREKLRRYQRTHHQAMMMNSSHSPSKSKSCSDLKASSNAATGADSILLLQDLVVHSVVCNERKTDDGVSKGGDRLVLEMLDTIRQEMQKRNRPAADGDEELKDDQDNVTALQDVTISLLGNSLGGIYCRYAIAKLGDYCEIDLQNDEEGSLTFILDKRYRLHFNIFCTTASPHLGIAGHTFLPIPRTAEIGVAHAMGDTGKDLFRLNNLMKDMATTPEYLKPLGAFRKRIAYANAYGTDFPVPVHTAAFLSKSSTYPHHFLEDSEEKDRLVLDDNGLVIASLQTPPRRQMSGSDHTSNGDGNSNRTTNGNETTTDANQTYVSQDDTDELVFMSSSLDALGWTKVFVDVRKEVPKIILPKALLRKAQNSSNGSVSTNVKLGDAQSDDEGQAANSINQETSPEEPPLRKLRKQRIVSSREVAEAVTAPLFDEKFHWPMGHNMIVAFSRSRLSTYMNKGGRPVVDALARDLVENMFSWERPSVADKPESCN